jgi:hypothetical protein
LNEKVAARVKKTELTAGEIRCADHVTPSIRKSCHNNNNKSDSNNSEMVTEIKRHDTKMHEVEGV